MVGDGDVGPGAGPSRRSSICVKRKRTPRVTSWQIEELLEKLERRPFLCTRMFTGLQGRENFETGWKEVADELNRLPNGSIKTPEQWMTVWRDFKSRACSKAAKLQKEKVQTGNRGVTTAPLTEMEKRIISLIGLDYTFGTDCPDSMPEEDILQHEMEAGIEISEAISLPTESNEFEYNVVKVEEEMLLTQTTASDSRATDTPLAEQQFHESAPQITVSVSRATAANSPPPAAVQQARSKRNRNLNPRRSVAEQHSTARADFLAVAASNAESMRMLAAATQVQAEASKMQAEATKVQAEAAKVQADASLLFAQAADKIADAFILFAKNNK